MREYTNFSLISSSHENARDSRLTPNLQNGIEEWRIVFWISAAVFFSATVIFWIFGSADIQPWNDYSQAKISDISEEEKHMNQAPITKEAQAEEDEENARL